MANYLNLENIYNSIHSYDLYEYNKEKIFSVQGIFCKPI